MTDQDHLDRIDALTRNARNTWFGLLGALVFVGITLMSVEHIDFYGTDRATQLPLVNVEVPTRYFFAAAPILIAAIYGYFHLYLIRLWDVLGAAPARIGGARLGDAITPWLVTDAALFLRRYQRRDNCTKERTLEGTVMLLNLLLAWTFGLFILLLIWIVSMPARTFWLTGLAGASLAVASVVGASSAIMMLIRMTGIGGVSRYLWFGNVLQFASLAASLGILLALSWNWTSGQSDRLWAVSLVDEAIVQRPPGWLSYDVARDEFRDGWCRRKGITNCTDLNSADEAFENDWQARRQAAIVDIRRPDWHKQGRAKPDLRRADLDYAFMVGLNLSGAAMHEADLSSANLEGAQLSGTKLAWAQLGGARLQGAMMERANLSQAFLNGADLQNAVLREAQMPEAGFERAQLSGVDLSDAQLPRGNLREAQISRASLLRANLNNADLGLVDLTGSDLSVVKMRNATLSGADLTHARMNGADFTGTTADGAVFDHAIIVGVSFRNANLYGARFRGGLITNVNFMNAKIDYALITGKKNERIDLYNTGIGGMTAHGAAMRFVRGDDVIASAPPDLRNLFFDGTVTLPEKTFGKSGFPCQSTREVLTEIEFYGRWRGWIEVSPNMESWEAYAPPGLESVEPIAPPPGCRWKG